MSLFIASNLFGCGRQVQNLEGDFTKAASDLKNIATGLQSVNDNSTKISNEAGKSTAASAKTIKLQHVTPEGTGWITNAYSNSWVSQDGSTVVEEGSIAERFLDENGNPLAITELVTWETKTGQAGKPIVDIIFKVKNQQIHQHFSSAGYSGVLNTNITFPRLYSFPLTMKSTGEGSITYTASSISTFEISSISVDMLFSDVNAGSLSANISWGYLIPTSNYYAYYYGTLSLNADDFSSGIFSASGDLYQDLTDNGIKDGVRIGSISQDSKGNIKIILSNGSEILP